MVINVPIDVNGADNPALMITIPIEIARFYFFDNFVSLSPITSSIESLVGNVQNGVAKVTTNKMANSEM